MKKVFTTGTFDILHYGHISLLRRAKALGDYLIVGVNVNPEGKTPFYSYEERKQILLSIKYVDEVVPLYRQEDKFSYLKHVQIFACGSEYKEYHDIERIKTFAQVVFLDRTPNISTTKEKEYLRSRERYNTICIDIDDTLCFTKNRDFENSYPIIETIKQINRFHDQGWKIILSTARGAKSCKTVEERIAKYDTITRAWLDKNGVKYDELWFGKPNADFYIDDKNLSINEFLDFQGINIPSNLERFNQFEKERMDLLESCNTGENIDIIVPWVDPNDEAWRADFNKYRQLEIDQGIQDISNVQAFGTERTRDWGVFKYWFRCVEKNCPWVHKVFLVVQRESQLPEWLNKECPKLRIVYHDEFIPEEFLPTFSTLVIETFYYRIKDLSNHFIVCNDDFYFMNPIPKDMFFEGNTLCYGETGTMSANWSNGSGVWSSIVNNTTKFLIKNICGQRSNYIHYSHLPDGRLKSYEVDFMSKYMDEIWDAMKISHFRHKKNVVPSLLFIDSMKYKGVSKKKPRIYQKSNYFELNSYTPWDSVKNREMVCLNDTKASSIKEDITRANINKFFETNFPEKSSFEK